MINPWMSLWWKGALLAAEAQQVVGMRVMGALMGNPLDLATLSNEKMDAAFKANIALARHIASGGDAVGAAAKSVQVYRRKVRSNRRKLTRQSS